MGHFPQNRVEARAFTKKKANIGLAHVHTLCPCREIRAKDSSVKSKWIGGWRFIPVELINLPGLKGAAAGKELGNQFSVPASREI